LVEADHRVSPILKSLPNIFQWPALSICAHRGVERGAAPDWWSGQAAHRFPV